MTKQFRSCFKKHIIGLLQQKRALGRVYVTEETHLKDFDSFCINYCPSESTLTKSIVLKWSESRENESPNGRRSRISPIRELAKYMNGIGLDSYILPSHLIPRQTRYAPHIYTQEELTAVFFALDQLRPTKRSPIRHLVFPVLFRMIYCCGLRPGEGREVLRSNVDLKTGHIVVQNSKNYKDRVVALSADMSKLCRRYDKAVDDVFPERHYFFPNPDGKAYSPVRLDTIHRQCLKDTKRDFSGNPPRVYDFRHTFATNAIFRWMKEGKDVAACLPYLSAYLGHEHLSYTALLHPPCSTTLLANIRHVPEQTFTPDS